MIHCSICRKNIPDDEYGSHMSTCNRNQPDLSGSAASTGHKKRSLSITMIILLFIIVAIGVLSLLTPHGTSGTNGNGNGGPQDSSPVIHTTCQIAKIHTITLANITSDGDQWYADLSISGSLYPPQQITIVNGGHEDLPDSTGRMIHIDWNAEGLTSCSEK